MTHPVIVVHVPLYDGQRAVDTGQATYKLEAMTFAVADSVTRMTDLCRALGILEAWQTAACLESEALVRANTIRLARMRLDLDARTVNGVALTGAAPDVLARETQELERVKIVCALRGAVAFVAKARPVWLPATAADTPPQVAAA